MRKILLSLFTLGMFSFSMSAENAYGIPDNIQEGNILHCFNWPIKTVTSNLQSIAEAGYGAVQLSPLQRADVQSNWHWYDLYCPYDIALMESSALGSRSDLKNLCAEAEKYGIKVIVDVVANHINWTEENGKIYYNKSWWSVGDRTRGGRNQPAIGSNYNNRENITQNRMGDYFEVNSENKDVINKTVAYIEDLASCGVKGIRWDAAKHIALPSERQGGEFWAKVTSVPGLYHYGEILDDPVAGNGSLINEYVKYMSVTDNQYSNYAARDNGGVPTGANGNWVNQQGVNANKLVYWAESHDTYSNDEWSQDRDQSIIDRAYAAVACRKGSTALYLARPNQKGWGNITITKGTDAYKNKSISEVNKFRNIMKDRADYFSNSGNACSITRQGGGAVIVMKGSGNVSVPNGGEYVPAGEYKDRVSGATFKVTSSTISGNVGPSGIAVIYGEALGDYDPDLGNGDNGNNNGGNTGGNAPSSLYLIGNMPAPAGWGETPGTGFQMTKSGNVFTASNVTLEGMKDGDPAYFRFTVTMSSSWNNMGQQYGPVGGNVEVNVGSPVPIYSYTNDDSSYSIPSGIYDIQVDFGSMKMTVYAAGQAPKPGDNGDNGNNNGNNGNNGTPAIVPEGRIAVFVKASQAPNIWAWTDDGNINESGTEWPGEKMTLTCSDGSITYYYWVAPSGVSSFNCIFNFNGDTDKTADIKDVTKNTYFVYNGSSDAGVVLPQQSVPSGITIKTGNEQKDPDESDDPNIGIRPEGDLYILGDLEANGGWFPNVGLKMEVDGSTFVGRNIKIVEGFDNTKGFISFTTYVTSKPWGNDDATQAAAWADLNANATRYGYSTESMSSTPLKIGDTLEMTVNNGDVGSFEIIPGNYDVVVNPARATVSLYNAGTAPSGIEDITTEVTYYISAIQGAILINNLNGENVIVAGIDGKMYFNGSYAGDLELQLQKGLYIVNVQGKSLKIFVR